METCHLPTSSAAVVSLEETSLFPMQYLNSSSVNSSMEKLGSPEFPEK